MSKNKLSKFADMDGYPHVFQCPYYQLREEKGGRHEMSGKWRDFFGNDNPIVLELGCGRGEYTVGLAAMYPDKNFIGVDIKGSRMWAGATESLEKGMKNVAFIRTNIEAIDGFFNAGEVSEIWITFPDPQMKKVNKRLTGTRFIQNYQKFLKDNATIHLKTDSQFMFTYTCEMVRSNGFEVLYQTDDLYNSSFSDDKILSIRTYYEQQWLDRGLSIKYIKFAFNPRTEYIEPDIEIEFDSYRSYNRSKRSGNDKGK
ncbi:MAG: tRNA (guanosine(46)-N7)-methyltransferase TrmB [Paludibacteraceae bacterium]|nr:tRNA (guanosine(46)-N7)-methyltransferase TrmB [Paludibacteraceae bacterium]